MGAYGLLLLLVVGFIGSISGHNGDNFFVVAPNMFRFEHPETVMISVFGSQKTVKIWLSHKDITFSEHTATVSQDNPHQTNMIVRQADLALKEREEQPRTIMLNAEYGGVTRQKEILIKYSSGYIFVQTSQPLYKPRDKVKIRYLALKEDMKKVGKSINVTMDIISPENQVFSRTQKTDNEAFYQQDFDLPKNVPEGIWTIRVYYRGLYRTEARAFFEVREYTVPTFGVEVSVTPNTILPYSNDTITVTVKAKYVYGKPVAGKVDIAVYLAETSGQTELLATPKKRLNAEGIQEFDIDMDDLKFELQELGKWFPSGQRLKVVANVTEGATLKREGGVHDGVVFSDVPYIIKFPRSKKYFRPLRKFYLKLDVLYPNGQPARGVSVKAFKVAMGDEKNGETDDNGQITFIFTTTGDTMTFKADDMNDRSPSEEFVVEAYTGLNQIVAEHIIKDGEHQIRAPNNMQNGTATGLTSMIIARGKIIDSKYESPNNDVVKILTNSLQEKMSPSGRYIVFYCDTRTNEVVADAIKITLTPRCKGQPLHVSANEQMSPGDSNNITVTGQRGTDVGLSILDKALLLLNNKNILHKNKLVEEMNSHDMGCGYGGGRNSAHVFSNAGLTVITDANMNTDTRDTISCEGRGRKKRSTDCAADRRCCDKATEFASSLYDTKSVVDKLECYNQARKLAIKFRKLDLDCLMAYFHTCLDYVLFKNGEDEIETRTGGSDYEMDLKAINFNEKYLYVRKNFQESAEFNLYKLGANSGQLTLQLKFPDSITKWMVQAIGLTPSNGVCIADPVNVTADRPFFIQLDLPYQAVRMEHIDVKATIFLYGQGKRNYSVSVYMDGVADLCSNVKPGRKSKRIEFEMPPNSAHTVRYPVIPLSAPKKYPIKITAILHKVGVTNIDAIQKSLYVINEGKEIVQGLSSCLDPMKQLQTCHHSPGIEVSYSGGEFPTQIITIDLTLPPHIEGTGLGTAYMYSDNAMEDVVQAVLIEGVDTLVRKPRGCVEQTVITLAPLVYATKFLQLTNQVTDKIEQDSNMYIKSGVSRQFSFKNSDNSYPPYARRDASTWLTAFIAKVFCQAKKTVDGVVDEDVHVTPTINWLASHQNNDGSFTEYNYVNHRPLMGMSQSGRPALTAFILIALQECRTRSMNIETAVEKAMKFLESQDINTLKQDQYALAITTYALALSNSSKKMTTYGHLKEVARRSDGMMSWGWSGNGNVLSKDIEATSYALLAMLQLDDLRTGNETVRWLMQHRTSAGAFKSTQDTVVGLQALSEYNIRTYNADVDLTVKFIADHYEKVFKLNKANALVLKRATDLPVEAGSTLYVEVTGKGTGNLKLDLSYNVEKTGIEEKAFEIDMKTEKIEIDSATIELGKARECDCGVCEAGSDQEQNDEITRAFGEVQQEEIDVNFGRKKRSSSESKLHCAKLEVTSLIDTGGMVTIEVGLETGMKVLREDLDFLVEEERISMYEMPTNEKGFFVLYIDKMFENERYKFPFTLEDTASEDVHNRQAASIKVTDYYNPDSKGHAFYGTGSHLEPSYKAVCSTEACTCLQNTCPESWKERLKSKMEAKEKNPESLGPAELLVYRACDSKIAEYAKQVKIIQKGDGNIDQKEETAVAKVIEVYNQGKERLRKGENMTLAWRMDCKWPQFKLGKKYYIIAKDGKPAATEAGQKKYKYYINEDDIVLEWKPKRTPVGTFMRSFENFWKTRECPK